LSAIAGDVRAVAHPATSKFTTSLDVAHSDTTTSRTLSHYAPVVTGRFISGLQEKFIQNFETDYEKCSGLEIGQCLNMSGDN
jgi:hypothetical protein